MVTLVSYMPALHDGYIKMLKEAKPDLLFLIDDSLAAAHPNFARDLSHVPAAEMVKAVAALGLVPKVSLLTDLAQLPKVISSDDHQITDFVLGERPRTRLSYFLRWDMPRALSQAPVDAAITVTHAAPELARMKLAKTEAALSSDWWRQVGAAVFRDGELLLPPRHNEHLPVAAIEYAEGDPRSWFDAGQGVELTTAIHAEQAVIAEAAAKGIALAGASIYVTTFPCPTCANLIASIGFAKCYFADGYSSVNGQKVLQAFGVEIIKVSE